MEENQNIQEDMISEETMQEPSEPTDEDIINFRWKLISFIFLSVFIAFIFVIPTLFNETHKPAIYLYPDKEQKVEIKLSNSIKYLNTIPNYHKGWVVMAKPTGILYDLQPQYTDCEKLPSDKFGFEYSKKACENNTYPYIFWDGVQITKPLPQKDVGFIVKKEEIENFLNDSADALKMNRDEKAEFMSYWANMMREKDYENFRVYFFQNEEVDDYLPIKVSPKPKSSNRVQIVINQAQEDEQIEPQELIPFTREGFTLVEWGGVIK